MGNAHWFTEEKDDLRDWGYTVYVEGFSLGLLDNRELTADDSQPMGIRIEGSLEANPPNGKGHPIILTILLQQDQLAGMVTLIDTQMNKDAVRSASWLALLDRTKASFNEYKSNLAEEKGAN